MKLKFPAWFWIGLIITMSSWIISWNQIKPFSYYTFAGIWIGFILILDGINFRLKGSSMLTRDKVGFFITFLYSSMFWWVFEILVMVTKNWYYLTDRPILSIFEHQFLGSIYFSTVIPAVFQVAELLTTKNLFTNEIKIEKISKWFANLYPVLGLGSLIITIIKPEYFFPLMWIFLYFVLDYINYKAGFDNLIKDVLANKWRRILTLAIASIICGFFWEMWNSYADPKWIYQIPYWGEFKVFEMPVLGFIGYLPFGLEIFAFFSFFQGIIKYPKEKFFNLTHFAQIHNKHPLKAILTLIFILITIMIGLGLIEEKFFNTFESKNKFFVEILPANINSNIVSNAKSGQIQFCVLGIIPAKCLIAPDKEVYLLIDNLGETINVDNHKAIVVGQDKISPNNLGLKTITVKNIYKVD